MDVNGIIVSGLTRTRQELVDQRGDLDNAIKEMDMLIARYNGAARPRDDSEKAAPSEPVWSGDEDGPTINEAIADLFEESSYPMRAKQVFERLAHHGWQEGSVRKTLTAMALDGTVVRRVDRGLYGSAKTSGDTVGAVPPETVPTTRSEGGTGVEPPTPSLDQDHGPLGEREVSDRDRETGLREVAIQF